MKKLICTALVLLLAICPVAMAEEGGASDYSFTFATTDLDGNIVTSAEIYAGNKITMINFWATWCPPCVGELAELAEVHTQLQEAGCGVVGGDNLVFRRKRNGLEEVCAVGAVADNLLEFRFVDARQRLHERIVYGSCRPVRHFVGRQRVFRGVAHKASPPVLR